MAAPLPQTIIIACPHCGTRYQVPADTIGPGGRQVACAHCSQTWTAEAPPPRPRPAPAEQPDKLFDEAAERELDRAFATAEDQPEPAVEHKAGRASPAALMPPAHHPPATSETPDEPGPADPREQRRQQRAFRARQATMLRRLPLARIRRSIRMTLVVLLLALVGAGLMLRTELVRAVPDLAGAYEVLGLGINVVGLEFRDLTTLVSRQGGDERLQVDTRIYSVAASTVAVPAVIITILGADDTALYEWSVAPALADLQPGEVVPFSTQLAAPPAGAAKVRLSFAQGRGRNEAPINR